jgi:prophage regulatory protein
MTPETTRLITKKQLRAMVPYTPRHILRLEKKGKFPKRIRVGENRVAWLLSDIEKFIADRVAARDRPPA